MIRIVLSFAIALTFILMSAQAGASEPKSIGTFGAWTAYMFMENGNKVCYMAAEPKEAKGDYTTRGKIYALITHRPAEGSRNVFSYITGYPYKAGSEVSIAVNGNTYTLFTQDDTAWAADAAADTALAEAIRSGSTMVVKGTSTRGTVTTDTFSLSGSSKAHEAISQECGS